MQKLKEYFPIIIELAIVFLAFFALYIYTICGACAAALDSIYYLVEFDNTLKLPSSYIPYHPHHLLYNPLVKLWLKFFKSIHIPLDTEFLLALLSCLFGVLTLCVFYWILRDRLQLNRLTAFIGTTLPAFSFGFWFYSVCIEVYTIPLFFLMLSIYLVTSDSITYKTFLLLGITHAIAVLFHQVHVLFITVIFLAAWRKYKRGELSIVKSGIYYASTFFPIVVSCYSVIIFGILKLHWHGKILFWLTMYAHKSQYWNALSFSSLAKTFVGFIHSILGFNFVFAIPKIKLLANKLFKANCLIDEVFLVRNMDQTVAYIFLSLSVIFFLVLIASIFEKLRKKKPLQDKHRNFIFLIGVWLITYTLFFFFWVPDNVEFWIPQSICCWLIFLTLWAQNDTQFSLKRTAVLSSIAVLLFVLNFGAGIRLIQDKKNDYYYQKTTRFAQVTQPNDLIIIGPATTDIATETWYPDTFYNYLQQYTDAKIFSLYKAYREFKSKKHRAYRPVIRLRKKIDRTLNAGHRVFISQEVLELEEEPFPGFGNTRAVINRLGEDYKNRWKKLAFGTDSIYMIE